MCVYVCVCVCVCVKHYVPNYMLSLKHALAVIFKHQKWLSLQVEKKERKKKTIIKGPAKFQMGMCKTVGEVAHTRYPW